MKIKAATRHLFSVNIFTVLSLIPGITQQGQSSRPPDVTLVFVNRPIIEVFAEITIQTGLNFIYNDDILHQVTPVTLHIKNQPVEKVLAEITRQTNLIFRQTDNTIAVRMGEPLRVITGVVTDETGEFLPGVNVFVKGTAMGTVTNANGTYILTVSGEQVVLAFSYMGYITQEATVGNRTIIDVEMKESVRQMDDVVVIGYGTQPKINLTGSVAIIGMGQLEHRPSVNLSSSMAGLVSGMTARQISGNPGEDGAEILIRGMGSFGGTASMPMIFVDGAPGSMDFLNPDDVESVSVLKDAAAATIYGARAANGVILITTRKGVPGNTPRVSYTGIFSSEQPIVKYNYMTDYANYMEASNRAYRNVGEEGRYSQSSIDAWRAATQNPNSTDNPWNIPNWLAYPNTDWTDALFQNKLYQKHTLSVAGGTPNGSYMLSVGYMDNPGTIDNTALERYQFRVNLETGIGRFLKVGTRTYAVKQDKQIANINGALLTSLANTIPCITPVYQGKYGGPENPEEPLYAANIVANLNRYTGQRTTTLLNTIWYAMADIYKGLSAEGRFNYQDYRWDEDVRSGTGNDLYSFRTGQVVYPGIRPAEAEVWYYNNRSYEYTATALLRYQSKFGRHSINALAGYEQYYSNARGIYALRHGLTNFSVADISSAEKTGQVNGFADKNSEYGAQYDDAIVSFFGRIQYAYRDRYLLETNLRYDGISRYAPGNRWGLFPSVSGAWRISEEPFMQGINHVVSNLKLRLSWGQLDNITSGYYGWQSIYGKTAASFGGEILDGMVQTRLGNPDLQWEMGTTTGAGIDASFFDGQLGVELDVYNRLSSNIVSQSINYATMGTIPTFVQNKANMRNRGFEMALRWNDHISEFRYSVLARFSYNRNKIVSYKPDVNPTHIYLEDQTEGYIYNEYCLAVPYTGTGTYRNSAGNVDPHGGPRDGMIRTPEDLQWAHDMQAAGYSFNNKYIDEKGLWYGEYIMANLNGDNIYGDEDDHRFTGKSTLPVYGYALETSASWRGFDFYMLWTGNAGMYYRMYDVGINQSYVGAGIAIPANALTGFYYYNEANPADPVNNIYAKYPRLKYDPVGTPEHSTLSLYNASYIQLKSLRFGYTFPKQWIAKIHIDKMRIFIAGENLAMFSALPWGNSEVPNGGIKNYPISRQYAVGITVSF